jgi:hypothetical protein
MARSGDTLTVKYVIEGNLARLRVPAVRMPRRADRLWEHTCCEIFVARIGEAAYHEFNFSPSGEWAAYAFSSYRKGGPLSDATVNPSIAVRISAAKLELDATVQVGLESLRIGLSAVMEDEEGARSYWALRHAPGKPDFHHPDAFALELA